MKSSTVLNIALRFSVFLSVFINSKGFAQGCSDAGFCSVGTLKSETKDTSVSLKNKLGSNVAIGIGDDKVFILTPALFYERQIGSNWSSQTKMTVNYAQGNLGNNFGLGDLFQSFSFNKRISKKGFLYLSAGVKVPLNNANYQRNGRSLPMAYQSSLGTLDGIVGAGFKLQNFKAALGLQIPILNPYASNTKYSANSFLRSDWDSTLSNALPSSNGLLRAPDMLFKIEYHWNIGKKFSLTPGLLAIYHLKNDLYQPQKGNKNTIEIAGSHGLTLNILAVATYKLSEKLKIALTFGSPLINRKVRPDGLTRSFVLAPEISFSF